MNNFKRKYPNSHLVIICDDEGIFEAFRQTKEMLSDYINQWLSIIYAVSDGIHPKLFGQELKIFEKRFYDRLQVYHVNSVPSYSSVRQELLEAIINSNTSKEICFTVFGIPDFASSIFETLIFLGVDPSSIQTNLINK